MRISSLLPRLLATTALSTASLLPASLALANPAGGTVVGGSAAIATTGDTVVITQTSNRTAIDWQGFSIGHNETTRFVQPTSKSVALNRVTGSDASLIDGKLEANGIVYLINRNGVMVGNGAQVKVGGLVATTSDMDTTNFMHGRDVFDRPTDNPDAKVVNDGTISVGARGLVGLVAPGVENHGLIAASVGTVALGSAETFTVDLAGDGLLAFDTGQQVATNARTQVVQAGRIVNPGGQVLLTAAQAKGVVDAAIDMSGVIEAKSVGVDKGVIVLSGEGAATIVSGRLETSGDRAGGTIKVTGRDVAVTAGATLDASATRAGDGGRVAVLAGEQATIRGTIKARGGAKGGAGGTIETSSKARVQVAGATIDAGAAAGPGGQWLIDPVDAVLTSNPTDPIDIDIATVVAALNAGTDVTITTIGAGSDAGTITLGKPTDVDSNIVTNIGGDGIAILTLQANSGIQLDGAFGVTNQGGLLGLNLQMVKTPADGPATGGDINIGRVTADGGDIFVAADASGQKNEGGRVFFSGNVTTVNGGQMSLYAHGNTIEVDHTIDIDALSLAGLDLTPYGLGGVPVPAGALFAAYAPIANPRIEFGPVFVTGNVSSITIRDGLDGTPGILAIATRSLSLAANEGTGTLPDLIRAPTIILTGPPGEAVNVQTVSSAGGLDVYAEDLVAFDFAAIDTLQFGDRFSSLVRLGGSLDGGLMGNGDLALRAVSGGAIRIGEAGSFSPPDETVIDMGSVTLVAGPAPLGTISIGSAVETTITADSLTLQSGGVQTLGDNADTTIAVTDFTSGVNVATGLPAPAAQVVFGGAGSLPGAPAPVTLDFTASGTARILSAGEVIFADRANGTVDFTATALAIGNLVGDSGGYAATLLTGPVRLGNGGKLDMTLGEARIASTSLFVNDGHDVDIHGFSSFIAFNGGGLGPAGIGAGGAAASTAFTGAGDNSEFIIDYGSIVVGDPPGLGSTGIDAAFVALNASSGDLTVAPGAGITGTESVTFALAAGGALDILGDVAGGVAILAPYAPGQDVLIDTDMPANGLFTQANIDALTNFDQLIITTATGTGFSGPPAGTSTLTVTGATALMLPIDTLFATEFAAGLGDIRLGTAAQAVTLLAQGNLEIVLASTGGLTLAGLIDTEGGGVVIDAVAATFDNVVLDGSLTIDTVGANTGDVTVRGVGAVAGGRIADLTVTTGAAGSAPASRGKIDFSGLEADDFGAALRNLTLRGGVLLGGGFVAGHDLTIDALSTDAGLFGAGAGPSQGPGTLDLTVAGDLAGIALVATGDATVTGGGNISTSLIRIGGNLTIDAQGVAVLADLMDGVPGTPASTVGGDASLSGSSVVVANPALAGFRPISFGGDLTVTAAATASLFDLTLGRGGLTVTAPQTLLFGNIATSRDLTVDGNLLLTPDGIGSPGAVSGLASGGDLTVTGTIDAVPGGPGSVARSLALSGDAVVLEGAIGSLLPLASLSVTAGVLIDPPNVTTNGDQIYSAPKTIFTGTDYVTNGGNFVVTGAADFQNASATVDTRGSFAGSPGDIRFAASGTPQNIHAAGDLTFITRGLLRLAGLIDTDGGDFTIRNAVTGPVNLLIDGDLTIDTVDPAGTRGGTVTVRGIGGSSGGHDVTILTGPTADPDKRGDIDFTRLDFQGLGGGLRDVTLTGRDIKAAGLAAGRDLTVDARSLVTPSGAVVLAAGLVAAAGPGDLAVRMSDDLIGAILSATGNATIEGSGDLTTSLVRIGGDLTVDAGGLVVLADSLAGVAGAPASTIGGDATISGRSVVIADPGAAGFRPVAFGGDIDLTAATTATLFNLALSGGGLTVTTQQAVLTGDVTTRDTTRVLAPQTLLLGDLAVTGARQDLVLNGDVLLGRGIGAAAAAPRRSLTAAGEIRITGIIDSPPALNAGAPLGLALAADTVKLQGVIGGLSPLADLNVTAATLIDPLNVTTEGDQSYTGPQVIFAGDRYETHGGAFAVTGAARFDRPGVVIVTTSKSGDGDIGLGTGSSAGALDLDAGAGAVTATNITLAALKVRGGLGRAAMTGSIGTVSGAPAALLVDRLGLTTASYLFNGCVMAVGCTSPGIETGDEVPASSHNSGPPGTETGDITGVGPAVQHPTAPLPVVVQSIPTTDDDQRFRFSNTGKDQFWRLDVDEPAPEESQP